MADSILVNRAPVLTLWGAVVAQRMGFDEDAALTLGKALAGLNAQSKGRSLGIFGPPKAPEEGGKPKKKGLGEEFWVEVCGRPVPAKNTEAGVRAVTGDKPLDPAAVRRYLESKFGEAMPEVVAAMTALAEAFEPGDLTAAAYGLYERFRPQIASGQRGWGQKGELDLGLIRRLAQERK
jgi:hypothetical protein